MLGSPQKGFSIGNVCYGRKLQVYYVKQQCCSGALISQIKLIKQNGHQKEWEIQNCKRRQNLKQESVMEILGNLNRNLGNWRKMEDWRLWQVIRKSKSKNQKEASSQN